MAYRTYELKVVVNGVTFTKVEIDDHYKEAHEGHMSDELILKLVQMLDHKIYDPVKEYDDGLKVFVVEPLMLDEKPYRLVWFYYKGSHDLRVRTAFRVRRKK